MDTKRLHSLIENTQPNICQVVCYKDNKEVYSDTWNKYAEYEAVHVMSVTKSIVSLLISICIDKGYIKSIDDKILDYFPNYQVKRGEKTIYDVTIRHFLTMTAPLKCKGDPWSKVCISVDWTLTSLDFVGGRKDISDEFRYNTVCLHVLTGLIKQATGLTPVEFANKNLFIPLGIKPLKPYVAKSAEEHKQFTISKTPKEHVWFQDRLGVGTAGYGICMSASDLAKIGVMCLNNGVYNNQQIVSSHWIKEMTQVTHRNIERFGGMSYGLLWWILDEKKGIYAALGNSGNVIYINSSNNFVCGLTAYFKPTIFDRVEFIQKNIEPLFTK